MTATLEQTRMRLQRLVEVGRIMMSTLEPDELTKVILQSAMSLFSAEAGSIGLIDESARQLAFAYSSGGADVGSIRMELGQGIIGWVAKTGEGVICRDASKDKRFFGGVDAKTGYRTKSLLCAPLKQRGQLVGAIEVLNMAEPEQLDEEDLALLDAFGGLASTAIDRARLFTSTINSNAALHESSRSRYQLIIGDSPSMQAVIRLARTVGATNTTVLLLGESGTGTEVLARSIHEWSARSNGPFVPVNCVALTPELMESELFGHEKGSFTGAIARKIGKFELASGGTIFLDEIGELPPRLQTKLLRALQEKEIQRVGGEKDIRVDVRVVAATNRDLKEAIQAGDFREDLYYRLNVVSITMPPLRNHPEDIPPLVAHFIERYCREVKRPVLGIAPSAMELLKSYSWCGNVRELQNAIERAVVLCSGNVITPEDFPIEIRDPSAGARMPGVALAQNDTVPPLADAVDKVKRSLIFKALQRTSGNQAEAARLLGIQRSNLSRLMKALGMR